MTKKLYKYTLLLALFGFIGTACQEDEDVVTADAEKGAFVSIEGSSGSLAGSPDPSVELEEAPIEFTNAGLDYDVWVTRGEEFVEKLVVVKQFDGQEVEVATGEPGDVLSVDFASAAEFLEGFEGVTPEDLRVGDIVTIQTLIYMEDGRVLVNKSAELAVKVSCFSDLTGTYRVENSVCDAPFMAEITKNPDGTYHLTVADGGLLHRCSTNTTLLNEGTITEQCGEILPTGDLAYGEAAGYNIGNITGGTWDAETGTLSLTHTNGFFTWAPSEYTSTYVRQ